MPIITTSSCVLLLTALLPIAAAPALMSPDTITAYTLVGSLFAVLLAVSYMRMNQRTAWNWAQTVFTIISTVGVGWMLPEPLAWTAVKKGWITTLEIESIPKQAWALAAMVFGIGGSTAILTVMYWYRKKVPQAFGLQEEETVVAVLPGSKSELHITRKKPAAVADPDPPTKTP